MKPRTRRDFLKTSIAVPAALSMGAATIHGNESKHDSTVKTGSPIPRRKLGRNGPDVTILNIGGAMSAHSPDYLDLAWDMGIRYFDTSISYRKGKSEIDIGLWNKKHGDRRKDLFLVSKEKDVSRPKDLSKTIDNRLEMLQTDYLDLYFLHGMGPKRFGPESFNWLKTAELKDTIDALKESGKCRMVGFSCHDDALIEYLEAAAEGGFIDAIMLAYNPFHEKGGAFDKALTACHKAGIGLIAMKEMRALGEVPKRIPELDKLGLTTHQGILHAVWSDPRIASICSAMENVQHLEENTSAAIAYRKPLEVAAIEALKETSLRSRHSMCPGCAPCMAAAKETDLAFLDIARYVNYYETDGELTAKDEYRQLTRAEKDATGIDLRSVQKACQYSVNYKEILDRAQYYFA